jgi:N-acetylneuraminic acid mutarotase
MAYLDKSNFLLIYGGRNDAVNELYLNDLHILDTASLNWCAVSISKPLIPRCGHSMVITDDCLLIFGGINSDGYISPEIALYQFRTLVSNIVKKVLNPVEG